MRLRKTRSCLQPQFTQADNIPILDCCLMSLYDRDESPVSLKSSTIIAWNKLSCSSLVPYLPEEMRRLELLAITSNDR